MTPVRRLYTCCLLLMTILSSGAGCDGVSSPSTVTSQHDDVPDQEAWNTTIYLIEDDQQRVVVNAGHRVYFAKEKKTIIDQKLQVVFYDEEGVLASTLTADHGIIDEQSHDMVVSGNVVIVSPEHGTLETDSLRWVEKENRFITNAAVRISTEKDMITGMGFEADPGLNHWEILRNVRGRFDRGEELSDRFDRPESQE